MFRAVRLLRVSVALCGPGVEEKRLALAERAIYLDYGATTPTDPRVVDAMQPYLTELYGNPHSRTHMMGWQAEAAVENAREKVARLIGAQPSEIIFTSGATESNNIAIKGVANFRKAQGKNHVITVQTEHKCVLDSCRYLQLDGFDVTYLPVKTNGLIDMAELEAAMTDKTALVSVMSVHNEIGVMQPIAEIGALCRKKKIQFHTDAAQAVGKVSVDVERDKIDLMSISSHKVYGPKGAGALYLRKKPRVRVKSPVSGGGQERGVRSGTVSPFLCVALGAACDIAYHERERDYLHASRLADRLLKGLNSRLEHITVNGDLNQRYPGILNVSFECVEGESLLMGVPHIAVSSGSACTSASLEPSYVLRAIGVNAENAHTSLRFGIGRFSTEAEIDRVINDVSSEVSRLREMSPLWDLKLEGKDLSSIQWRA